MSTLKGQWIHFDGAAGAAGDMTLGALIDAGVPAAVIRESFDAMGLGGELLSVESVVKRGIAATNVTIAAESGGHGHRHFASIREQIDGSRLSPGVKARAQAIFARLARAEAKMHATSVDAVHFHEVGAVDAICDIVGAAAGIEWLAPSGISASSVCMGEGSVEAAHGRLPVPSPAALEIMREVRAPIRGGGVCKELCTPTGAAILAECVEEWGAMPELCPLSTGYGAGDVDLEDRPNVFRVTIGAPKRHASRGVVEVAANCDDMNPEWCADVERVLWELGALDVWWTGISMKKGRPALRVGALVPATKRREAAEALLAHSTSLGVRTYEVERYVLDREVLPVDTEYGVVQVKVGRLRGDIVNVAPEFSSAHEVAASKGVPLKEVYAAALAAFRRR